jgi:hypothetical protein
MFIDPPTKFIFGMSEWYSNELSKTFGGKAEDYLSWAGLFVQSKLEYHNSVRNDFKPHPEFEEYNVHPFLDPVDDIGGAIKE